jgi:hypothetical protein
MSVWYYSVWMPGDRDQHKKELVAGRMEANSKEELSARVMKLVPPGTVASAVDLDELYLQFQWSVIEGGWQFQDYQILSDCMGISDYVHYAVLKAGFQIGEADDIRGAEVLVFYHMNPGMRGPFPPLD